MPIMVELLEALSCFNSNEIIIKFIDSNLFTLSICHVYNSRIYLKIYNILNPIKFKDSNLLTMFRHVISTIVDLKIYHVLNPVNLLKNL